MAPLAPNEQLVVLRTDLWRFAVRLCDVERVLAAAMPVGLPSTDGSLAVRLDDGLVPVIFAAALFGAGDVELRPEDKMVLLTWPGGRTILWVNAVEDVVPFVPLPGDAAGARAVELAWASCISGGEQTLAVIDLERLVEAARP